MAELATNPVVRLEPYGEIKGVLERPTGPGTNEILDLAFVGPADLFNQRINLSNSSHTDASGHFDFKRVPSGKLQISYRLKMNGENGWQEVPLQQVRLKPGQTMSLQIKAPARQAPARFSPGGPPLPVRIPGVAVKGTVLLPNGRPAAGVQVGLQIKGQFLQLGRASLISYQAWQNGLVVRTGPDGRFTLPSYRGVESLIAVSEDGFALVSPDELKHSSQITLQPWGKIEGTFLVNHHPATNVIMTLSAQYLGQSLAANRKAGPGANEPAPTNSRPEFGVPLFYALNAFQTKTDDHGRFAMTDVPPGKQMINRAMAEGPGRWAYQPIKDLTVKPGEVTHVKLVANGRTVIGKVMLAESNAAPNWPRSQAFIQNVTFKSFQKLEQARTPEDRLALIRAKAFRAEVKHYRHYPAFLSADGSFKAEDVSPGKYELDVQLFPQTRMSSPPTNVTMLASIQEFVVPKAADTNNNEPVNVGLIKLKPFTIPVFTTVETNAHKSVVH